MKLSRMYMAVWSRIYSCDVDKNIECNKKNCAICHEDGYGCYTYIYYKYAKKTPLNLIKKIINRMRGAYKHG